jgi:hypothetical protein
VLSLNVSCHCQYIRLNSNGKVNATVTEAPVAVAATVTVTATVTATATVTDTVFLYGGAALQERPQRGQMDVVVRVVRSPGNLQHNAGDSEQFVPVTADNLPAFIHKHPSRLLGLKPAIIYHV